MNDRKTQDQIDGGFQNLLPCGTLSLCIGGKILNQPVSLALNALAG